MGFSGAPSGPGSSTAYGILGSGTDGNVTLDGVTTFPGFGAPVANVYTMTRDVYTTSLTINSGITLKPNNFRIFCTGTVTNNGSITANGNNAIGSAGGLTGGSGSLGGGRAGGAGGTGVSGPGGNGSNSNFGANGGAGGAGTSGTAGTAGFVNVNISNSNIVLVLPFGLIVGLVAFNLGTQALGFGASGGGGGSDAGSVAGGGGGGGGGIIGIIANAIINNGLLQALGGNGAAGAGGNAGGGGGAAGGAILLYTLLGVSGTVGVPLASVACTGGALGAGQGTGSNGVAGGNGLVLASVF